MAEDWKVVAIDIQLQFFETLGSRPYDEIEKSNIFLFKKKVGFATCGKPNELPNVSNRFTGYKEEELNNIKLICEKIIEKSDCDPVKFACTVLVLYTQGVICETPIFRIVTNNGNIFIDAYARVYETWIQFMDENKLPDCEYCFPLDGVYTTGTERFIGFAKSPVCGLVSKAANCLDTAGSVASVAAASVFAAGLMFSVAPAAIAAAGTTAACTGVYSISRNIGSLYDRNKHEQSIGLKNPESRSAWLSVGSSLASVATFGALEKVQKIVEGGESLSKLSVFGLHALTTSSFVFSGFGFVESLFICAEKYNKGSLTKKDIFDVSCELLFLFNAIESAKETTNLVSKMSSVVTEAPVIEKHLAKTQKRNLKKRVLRRRNKDFSKINIEITQTSNLSEGISTGIKLLLLGAVKAYAPRLEKIMYTCQSIAHDIMCWKSSEIPDLVFLTNLKRNITQLYNDCKEEISEELAKIAKYFGPKSFTKVMEKLSRLFFNASDEMKSIFCTKIINMEDQIDNMIIEAENEIFDLYNCLETEVESDLEIGFVENTGNELNSEAQSLLSACGNVVTVSGWPCQDLQEFEDILLGVKYVVVDEFRTKVSNYKNSLKAAKIASKGPFDIDLFNEALGIHCDVGQHIFNEILESLPADSALYKIKMKLKDIQRERNFITSPVWEGLTEGMFLYYGPYGAGSLSDSDLLLLVGRILKIDLSEKNCKLLQSKEVVMIELSTKSECKNHVVVYQDVSEKNTASGIIIILK